MAINGDNPSIFPNWQQIFKVGVRLPNFKTCFSAWFLILKSWTNTPKNGKGPEPHQIGRGHILPGRFGGRAPVPYRRQDQIPQLADPMCQGWYRSSRCPCTSQDSGAQGIQKDGIGPGIGCKAYRSPPENRRYRKDRIGPPKLKTDFHGGYENGLSLFWDVA